MGATCVAAVLHDQTLYAANVGDSRVYVLHEGALRQITRDHSLVAQLVERGEITPARGAHPREAQPDLSRARSNLRSRSISSASLCRKATLSSSAPTASRRC